jgi:Xaa-Pro aminopeptidase
MSAETMYINTNRYYRASIETKTREARFIKWWKEKLSMHKVENQINFTEITVD